MWWMSIIVVPFSSPPTRPSFARNSSMILLSKSLSPTGAVSAMISSNAQATPRPPDCGRPRRRHGPPAHAGRPAHAVGASRLPSADSVDQAHEASRKLLNLPQFEYTTTFRRREERLPLTGDQRIHDEPEFIDQPGVDQARRDPSPSHEIDVLAGLLLEAGDLIDSPDEARIRPLSRGQSA